MADSKSTGTSEETSPSPCINLAPIGPGNYDRAWNDPPMFDPRVNIMGKPAPNKLNKRVAYPMSGATSTATSQSIPAGQNFTSSVPLMPPVGSSVLTTPVPALPPLNVLPESTLKQ